MSNELLPHELLTLLRNTDTPTVCNAIEAAQGRRGFERYTEGTMRHSRPGAPPVVGFARTAKIAGRRQPTDDPDVIRARRMEYFRSMAAGLGPSAAVIEDLDFPRCIGAWWGEVHVAVHRGLGLTGAVTNGVMRDLDAMDEDFPVLAGSVGPSHAFVHVVEIGTPATVHGLTVAQGELIHADRHGALVIPEDVLPHLEDAIASVDANEALVLGPAREPGFDIDKLEAAWAAFESVRT